MTADRELDATLAAPASVAGTATDTPIGREAIAGRYEILGLLGAGGMGTVYKVRDRELDEIVALKTLKREWIDAPGALERFKREVKLARRVTHKNVARTFDIGETGTEKFLTMELVDGPSLARVVDERGALPVAEALRIGIAITEALEAAHEAGVVHRDLKPDNVLIARDGRVVVTDFGIARAQTGDVAMTGHGIVGTPAYMSPEQVEGSAIDPRSDLYALGLVLYEALTGTRAFAGESPLAVAAARLVRSPPGIERDDAPAALVTLVSTLLARRPGDRPADAAAVKHALTAITATPVAAAPARAADLAQATHTLAVLPIRGSGPAEDAWIADGLTDDLLDGLCMVRALRVRGRTASLPDEDARSFGRRVGVSLVVEGSVRRTGEQVRIGLRLSSTDDGYQIWAGRFEGAIGDLLLLADRGAREIGTAAGALDARPPATTPPPFATVDPRALELHARARRLYYTAQLETPAGIAEIDEAVRLAPDEPRILATHAMIYARMTFIQGADVRAMLAIARRSAERAVALAPDLAEAWAALATTRLASDETPDAARAAHRALRAGPSVAMAHEVASRIVGEAGRLEDARTLAERAVWLDPMSPTAFIDLTRVYALLGDETKALEHIDRIRPYAPVTGAITAARFVTWWPGTQMPEDDFATPPSPLVRRVLAVSRAVHEERATDADLDFLLEMRTRTPPRSRPRRFMGQVTTESFARTGRFDVAMRLLEDATDDGLEDLAWLDRCPLLVPLRERTAFAAVRARVAERARAILAAWDE